LTSKCSENAALGILSEEPGAIMQRSPVCNSHHVVGRNRHGAAPPHELE
jgi:hypothetical protein